MAQAYSDLGNTAQADLATSERYYAVGDIRKAAIFAIRARQKLPSGTPDWQRANDVLAIAQTQLHPNR